VTRFAKTPPAHIIGDMVVTASGRVGLALHERLTSNHTWKLGIAYVNNGPLSWFPASALRRATMKEITDAGLYGVGCNRAPAPRSAMRRKPPPLGTHHHDL
jgi:hypothetical protein